MGPRRRISRVRSKSNKSPLIEQPNESLQSMRQTEVVPKQQERMVGKNCGNVQMLNTETEISSLKTPEPQSNRRSSRIKMDFVMNRRSLNNSSDSESEALLECSTPPSNSNGKKKKRGPRPMVKTAVPPDLKKPSTAKKRIRKLTESSPEESFNAKRKNQGAAVTKTDESNKSALAQTNLLISKHTGSLDETCQKAVIANTSGEPNISSLKTDVVSLEITEGVAIDKESPLKVSNDKKSEKLITPEKPNLPSLKNNVDTLGTIEGVIDKKTSLKADNKESVKHIISEKSNLPNLKNVSSTLDTTENVVIDKKLALTAANDEEWVAKIKITSIKSLGDSGLTPSHEENEVKLIAAFSGLMSKRNNRVFPTITLDDDDDDDVMVLDKIEKVKSDDSSTKELNKLINNNSTGISMEKEILTSMELPIKNECVEEKNNLPNSCAFYTNVGKMKINDSSNVSDKGSFCDSAIPTSSSETTIYPNNVQGHGTRLSKSGVKFIGTLSSNPPGSSSGFSMGNRDIFLGLAEDQRSLLSLMKLFKEEKRIYDCLRKLGDTSESIVQLQQKRKMKMDHLEKSALFLMENIDLPSLIEKTMIMQRSNSQPNT